MNEVKLINMADVAIEEVKWLWYPYIPYGKITVIQGDPGEGKTTFILAVTALLSKGQPMPEQTEKSEPCVVIYQTAEDGLGDTIKPRLETAGADCSNVVVIDESDQELTLSDKRIEAAIRQTGAKLLILDPLQAYLGGNVDMHRANEIRPIFKQLAITAQQTGCAIVIIGHMNKMSGSKGMYRGLGSIDIAAAARSVLLVGRDKNNPNIRIMGHLKSSLAPQGSAIAFEFDPENGFRWIGRYEVEIDDLLNGTSSEPSKTSQAEILLQELLKDGSMPCSEIYEACFEQGIGKRTVDTAKKNLGIESRRVGTSWHWSLPEIKVATLQGSKNTTTLQPSNEASLEDDRKLFSSFL